MIVLLRMAKNASYPQRILIIAGPTSSGKSALALELAVKWNGAIINADSMQLYREIPVLSGQPLVEEQKQAPHYLYGCRDVRDQASAAAWAKDAQDAIQKTQAQGKLPILVGGTGLYIRALTEGLSDIPEISPDMRDQARGDMERLGPEKFHAFLAQKDPIMAARLKPKDRQRMLRAWEVFLQTGKSLADFQGKRGENKEHDFFTLLLLPEKAEIYQKCQDRFDSMMRHGALDEARRILAMNIDPLPTALKAKGIPELCAHLRGELSLDQAVSLAKIKTRQYAKRQFTWFSGQMRADYIYGRIFDKKDKDFMDRILPALAS